MTKHKTEDYKISAVKYYLNNYILHLFSFKTPILYENS